MKSKSLFFGALLLVACAKPIEDDAADPVAVDPAPAPASPPDAVGDPSSPPPAPARDAGTEGGVATECHGVAQTAPPVERVRAPLPTAQGGAITPGVYQLRRQIHASAVAPSTPDRATFRFSVSAGSPKKAGADFMDVTLRARPSSEDQRATLSMDVEGASLSLADECVSSYGSMHLDVQGYSATPTKVTLVGLRTAYELELVR
jgi:hypothetical protein